MDSLNNIVEELSGSEAPRKTSQKNKKRKWREIEAIQEKHRLRKELQELDYFAPSMAVDELDF